MNILHITKQIVAISTLLSVAVISTNLQADDWTFHVSGTTTNKSTDTDGWMSQAVDNKILTQEGNLGVIFDMKPPSWPVAIAIDVFITGDTHKGANYKEDAFTVEQHIGVRKYWQSDFKNLQAYVGGGIALTSSEFDSTIDSVNTTVDDSDVGYWVGIGTNWNFTKHWYVGFDLRYSTSELELFNQKRDNDGLMSGLTIGYTW